MRWIDEKKYWEPAPTADGDHCGNAWAIDTFKVIELMDYPSGIRIDHRAEPLHPEEKSSQFDAGGNRISAFQVNSACCDPLFLDVSYRARARYEAG